MFDANKLLVATYTEMDWNEMEKLEMVLQKNKMKSVGLIHLKMDVMVGLVHLRMKMMNMLILMNGINQFILHG